MHVNKIKGWFNWWKYLTILNNSFFDGESWKRPRWKSSDLAFSWKLIYLAPSPLRPLYLRLTCHAEASAKAKASEKVSLVGIHASPKARFAKRITQRDHLSFPISADAAGVYLSSECWDLTPMFPHSYHSQGQKAKHALHERPVLQSEPPSAIWR